MDKFTLAPEAVAFLEVARVLWRVALAGVVCALLWGVLRPALTTVLRRKA